MPGLVDSFRRHAIKREMKLFAETRRPIHAWRAYHWIRKAGLPIPPWFLEYLDGCAGQLTDAAPETAEDVAAAFGMGATGRHSIESRRLTAAEMVHALNASEVTLKLPPAERRLKDLFSIVARELGVSASFVKGAWCRYKKSD